MEDLERYGDYNETEYDMPRGKSPVMLILKILIFGICFGVIGILAFRLVVFNHYPDSVKELYFDSVLTEHYGVVGDDIYVKTQEIKYPYDDPDYGNFFCEYLYVTDAAGQLQITVRFNEALSKALKNNYGTDIDIENADNFSFRLVKVPLEEDSEPVEIGTLTEVKTDSYMMYRYFKLVFNDIDFEAENESEIKSWIRLEITVEGARDIVDGVDKGEKVFMVLIYDGSSRFSEYDIPKKELPAS